MLMAYNLNNSRKPEQSLQGNLIAENINIYGIQCKWLFSERINPDLVFRDFSHFRVQHSDKFKDVTLMPEDSSNWQDEVSYNSFGIFQNMNTVLFISKPDMLRLFPDFLGDKPMRHLVLNSLVITPSGTILEVTNVDEHHMGVSNLWAYADDPNSYKLTTKVYAPNISDEGISEIKTTVDLSEGPEGEIFKEEEDISTEEIDIFFSELESHKDKINKEAKGVSNTENPFGNLG